MKYMMLNNTVVCVNDIRNVYKKLGDIYIDFKCGTPATLKIPYFDWEESNKDFFDLAIALKDLEKEV